MDTKKHVPKFETYYLKEPSVEGNTNKNPFSNSIVNKPVYHGSNIYFKKFKITSDIGYHFGTKLSAKERMVKTGGSPEFEIEEDFPSKLEWLSYKIYKNQLSPKSNKDKLKHQLVRTLDNPNLTQIQKELNNMNDDEVQTLLTKHESMKDSKQHLRRIKRYQNSPRKFHVMQSGDIVKSFDKLEDAEMFSNLSNQKYSKPRKFFINITKAFKMPDLGLWSVLDISREMKKAGLIKNTNIIMDIDNNIDRYNKIRKIFKENGYDGIIYKNNVEDSGSTSYIVFDNSQILEIK